MCGTGGQSTSRTCSIGGGGENPTNYNNGTGSGNTGSGGGGRRHEMRTSGYNGGSGIVIVRYQSFQA